MNWAKTAARRHEYCLSFWYLVRFILESLRNIRATKVILDDHQRSIPHSTTHRSTWWMGWSPLWPSGWSNMLLTPICIVLIYWWQRFILRHFERSSLIFCQLLFLLSWLILLLNHGNCHSLDSATNLSFSGLCRKLIALYFCMDIGLNQSSLAYLGVICKNEISPEWCTKSFLISATCS